MTTLSGFYCESIHGYIKGPIMTHNIQLRGELEIFRITSDILTTHQKSDKGVYYHLFLPTFHCGYS